MTDDPKRWVDDESAPHAMREFLRDARLEAPTLDDETRRRVRRALVRPGGARSRAIVVGSIVAVAAVLLLVLWPSSEPPRHAVPGVQHERDAGVVDGAPRDAENTIPGIRLERTCGEEDVDYACTVDVETSRPFERVDIHWASGLAPPSCDGRMLEAEWIRRSGPTHLTIESGVSYHPQLALRVCAYDGDALVATGSIEGTRSVPSLEATGMQDAAGTVSFDLRVVLDDDVVDDDAVSFAIVRQQVGSDEAAPPSCAGDVVVEIPRALVVAFVGDRRVAYPVHLAAERSRAVAFVVCARDASGALTTDTGHPSYPPSVDWHVPMVTTPSGAIPIDALLAGHRVVTRVRATQRPNTTPGPAYDWQLDVVDRIDSPDEHALHRLELADGQWATLPSFLRVWVVERGALVDLDDLQVGEHVVTAEGHEVAIRSTAALPEGDHAWYGEPVLAAPATYFVDGVLVGGQSTRARPLASGSPPWSISGAEAWPATSVDCSLRSTLEISSMEALATTGASAVALVFAPHRGAPGTLRRVDCATARVGFEASVETLALVPADATGRRRLSIDMPSLPGGDDAEGDPLGCEQPFAVMACVRDASGLHALYGAQGRWATTGPSCFDEHTLVTTERGARAIASLHRGETLVAYDPVTRQAATARVERLISRGRRPILALTLSTGVVLRVTAEHPLFDTRTESFREAGTFAVGDALRGADGADVFVLDTRASGSAQVYDLSVTEPHTFVAGGIVAHNY